MSALSRVLLCSGIQGLKEALERVLAAGAVRVEEIDSAALNDADVLRKWKDEVLVADNDRITRSVIYARENTFRFVQSTWAGVDRLIPCLDDSLPAPSLVLSRFTNPAFAALLVEYLVAHVICSERGFLSMAQERTWRERVRTDRTMAEVTVGILGVGEMGRAVAKAFKSLGSRVLGHVRALPPRKASPHVDEYFDAANLSAMLAQCDYICSILPKNKYTDDLLGGDLLQVCKARRPALLNVGRSNVLSEFDLLRALDSDWLSSAVLDVFDVEPLPNDHVFWRHPRVVVTPHCAAVSRPTDIAACFRENLDRVDDGRQPANVVDWKNMY